VVSTIAVAVAFNGAAASVLDTLLVHPYRYPALGQLLLVRDARPREGAHQGRPLAAGDVEDIRTSVPAFASVASWRPAALVVTSSGADPERIEGVAVSAEFFALLGITPAAGRTFGAGADRPGADAVVVLSRRIANSRFGGAREAVGREVALNGRRAVVAGVIGDGDCYPSGVDAWVPLVLAPSERADRVLQNLAGLARLAASRSDAEADGQLRALALRLARAYPATNRDRGFETLPLRQEQYEFTAPLFTLVELGAVLVLLVASLNVAHLLLLRTLDREHELAIRAFVGASRAAITRLVALETLALAAAGCALGVAITPSILAVVRASLPDGIARWVAGWSSMSVSPASAGAAAAFGLLAGCATAAVAAAAAYRLTAARSTSSRATTRRRWGRRIVVGGEVAATVLLLVGATVMVKGLERVERLYDSTSPARLLRFTLTLPEWRYPEPAHVAAFHARVLDALRSRGSIEAAALIRNEPASNVPTPTTTFEFADAPAASPADLLRADLQSASPDLFRVLRIDIVEGRTFAETDAAGAPRVAIVSREAVRRFWNGHAVVGSEVRLGGDRAPVRVIGIAADTILNWYDPGMRPVIYVADAQFPARTAAVMIRTRVDPASAAREARAAVASLDDRQPISGLEPMTTTIADSVSPLRIIGRLLAGGAAIAALLAALGIYTVLAHAVHARRRELGIRFAVGATRGSVAWLVVRDAVSTASVGAATGFVSGVAMVRAARGVLLGVATVDARSAAAIGAAVAAITFAAAFVPARRAAQADVAELLQVE
jgi:predicted permease